MLFINIGISFQFIDMHKNAHKLSKFVQLNTYSAMQRSFNRVCKHTKSSIQNKSQFWMNHILYMYRVLWLHHVDPSVVSYQPNISWKTFKYFIEN